MSNEQRSDGAWIHPDSRGALRVVVIVTAMLALVSFAVSFAGLAAVAEWAAIPNWLAWALPVFIDGAIIVYTIAMLVFRSRGHSTVFVWTAMLAFTAVSVAANASHAYAEGAAGHWQTWVGAGLAGLAPAGVAVAIHTIAMLTVRPPLVTEPRVALALQATDYGRSEPGRNSESVPHVVALDPPNQSEAIQPGREDVAWTNCNTLNPGSDPQNGASARSRVRSADPNLVARAVTLRDQQWSHQAIADELGRGKTTVGRWLRAHDKRTGSLRAVQ